MTKGSYISMLEITERTGMTNKEDTMRIDKTIFDKGVELAKAHADLVLKGMDTKAIEEWVAHELERVTQPLEDEIKTTKSWWVKLRNRAYINVIQQSAGAIVANIEKEIKKL